MNATLGKSYDVRDRLPYMYVSANTVTYAHADASCDEITVSEIAPYVAQGVREKNFEPLWGWCKLNGLGLPADIMYNYDSYQGLYWEDGTYWRKAEDERTDKTTKFIKTTLHR